MKKKTKVVIALLIVSGLVVSGLIGCVERAPEEEEFVPSVRLYLRSLNASEVGEMFDYKGLHCDDPGKYVSAGAGNTTVTLTGVGEGSQILIVSVRDKTVDTIEGMLRMGDSVSVKMTGLAVERTLTNNGANVSLAVSAGNFGSFQMVDFHGTVTRKEINCPDLIGTF